MHLLNTYIDDISFSAETMCTYPVTVLPTLVQYYFTTYITHNAFGCLVIVHCIGPHIGGEPDPGFLIS